MSEWRPLGTRRVYGRPDVGSVVANGRGVWRVTAVVDVPILDDADRDAWQAAGMPNLNTWRQRPYRVRAVHLGGVSPEGLRPGREALMTVHARTFASWMVYPHGRWPQCSCCGEPMPCRAETEDLVVESAERRIAKMEARIPGCCWACEEPITSRQRSVVYEGWNLDLPTAEPARFHLRRKCLADAYRYEERWLRADPRRQRILTYPDCPGTLIVHGDGSSECHGGLDECHGHATHDHRRLTSCYLQTHGCPRECQRVGHPGCSPSPRPRRDTGAIS